MPTEEDAVDGQTGRTPTGDTMRARHWTIAANYHDPVDYGIPELPDWTVYREDGALALGVGGEVVLRADEPVPVRR